MDKKRKMRKDHSFIKEHWTLIWLIMVVLAASVFITFGAYTGLKAVKRVVITQSAPGVLFSSNCMRTDLSTKKINSASYDVTVCNYEQKNPMVPNPSAITYDFNAELRVFYNNDYVSIPYLRDHDNDAYQECLSKLASRTYSIAKTVDDAQGSLPSPSPINLTAPNYSHSYSSEGLRQEISSADTYTVYFPSADLDLTTPEFYVYVSATPNQQLGSIESLLFASKNTTEASAWRGVFLESDTTNTDYDFYNYIISGSGKGTVRVMWDSTWFEVNPFFFTMMGITSSDIGTISDATSQYNGWSYISITVDSTVVNRYEIQLYKVRDNTPYTGSDAASSHVACVYTATTA